MWNLKQRLAIRVERAALNRRRAVLVNDPVHDRPQPLNLGGCCLKQLAVVSKVQAAPMSQPRDDVALVGGGVDSDRV